MDAVKFLKEIKRLCKQQERCDKCLLYGKCSEADVQQHSDGNAINELVRAVEEWSDEHPAKTRLQDFLEKHPNAPLEHFGAPWIRPVNLGYCNSKNCTGCDMQYSKSSAQCWNLPLEE